MPTIARFRVKLGSSQGDWKGYRMRMSLSFKGGIWVAHGARTGSMLGSSTTTSSELHCAALYLFGTSPLIPSLRLLECAKPHRARNSAAATKDIETRAQ